MAKAGIAATLAVSVSASFAGSAAAAVPLRFSRPLTLGRSLNNGNVLRAEDLSGDGIPDLVSADPFGGETGDVSVWLGRGDGSFGARRAYRTVDDVWDVAVSDLNGDSAPELIAAGLSRKGPISILVNDGNGRFRRDRVVRSGLSASSVAATDLNHDGLIDLLMAGGNARHDVSVLLREPAGGFLAPRRFRVVGGDLGAIALGVADIDGDGNVDLALTGGDAVAVVLGNGDGTFAPASFRRRLAIEHDLQLADVNRDGKLDLLLTKDIGLISNNQVVVFLGNGDGTFVPGPITHFRGQTFGFVVTDLDGDANPDVTGGGFVLNGRGDGSFARAQPLPGSFYAHRAVTSAVADFDLDGRPDIAIGAGEAFDGLYSIGVYFNWTGLPAPPCVVPPLTRRSNFVSSRIRLSRAKRLLHANGCSLGRVRSRASRRVRRGRILEQAPKAGSVLPSHTRIDLVVSRGRRR
jgi:FG-GAP-like repeat